MTSEYHPGQVVMKDFLLEGVPTTVSAYWDAYVSTLPQELRTSERSLLAMKTVFFSGFSASCNFFVSVIGEVEQQEADKLLEAINDELNTFGGQLKPN